MIEEKCINAIRFLSADAAEKAKSGHPGMPMGAAALAYTLWMRHLKHNPANPSWVDRDRVVLSAGHASMLLYSLLYLTGYDLTREDIQAFRQWGSKTPGHPERSHPPGTEMTTGPLGQGISHAVGMAMAEAHLAACYNRPGHTIIDHYTYTLASDGDLMEGVTFEACALAGHLGLGKLIVLYDDNGISLAGATALSFTEDVDRRFAACGWQVLTVTEGNNIAAIDEALASARGEKQRPTLIRVMTCIGFGAPTKEGTAACHGSPLGREELRAAKERLGWPLEPSFYIPEAVLAHYRQSLDKGKGWEEAWQSVFDLYTQAFPEPAREFQRIMTGELPGGWETGLPDFGADTQEVSTRKASETVLQSLASIIPELMGGSADLNPSCLTWLKGKGDFQNPDRHDGGTAGAVGGGWNYGGRNIHFGVREHAMGAIAGGMALHGGVIPYTATFFTFADYMRPPIRLAALMGLRVIYVFTHDSIAVGEDGPTHQPIEQLMNLRSVPNLSVIRPCDAAETAQAWQAALANRRGPTAIVLTRQNVPNPNRQELAAAAGLQKGGYILWDSSQVRTDVIFIATGSEVHLALAAARKLTGEAIRVRVVSIPSWDMFDAQPAEYRDRVLPPAVKARVAVEAGARLGWEHYVGLEGAIVGMDRFGASAPATVLYEKFGLTVDHIVDTARSLFRK
ncbi:MAG: transketolase [Thermodesulfobacteriota bacterium]|nr:transketolase [Thermodesulfobacteriota bacterium]